MQEQIISPAKFSINYGIILGVVFILINVIMYVTGMALEGKQWPQYLYYLIFPITIFYAINQFKKKNANILSLSEAIKIGVIAGIISALIYIVYSLIFFYLIDPGFMDQIIDVTRDKLLENPNLTEEIVDQQMKVMKMFMNPFIGSAFWIAMSAFFGLIYGLIGGLVMKKENTHA